ncbi:DUF3348 domain-containing protein [Luteimonas sp. FCS-9]|uniref:DUF3348 domain-containing protein n=1 Tax=Luteimonas sp. FCS-9 TaxID=1547516 RepID=UPI00063EBFD3|nr:DUF3348 domain-containing protein [Luteimonas sp. FCS-9]KLI98988.1 hypothetical protein WQ56_13530 [Luteimonas sp. FCS-9]
MDPSPRPTLQGPTFVRLLARLTDAEAARAELVPADRLSEWIDWTRAVALSKVLDAPDPAPAQAGGPAVGDHAASIARARATLAEAIATAPELAAGQAHTPPGDAGPADSPADAAPDFAPLRQRCLTLQRAMQAATGRLRGDLREMLAQRSAQAARLAEVDAVMEGALSPREHALLGAVPTLLEAHFERLRAGAAEAGTPASSIWLDGFRRDMQGVLNAELDVRFQPVDALLAALRTP